MENSGKSRQDFLKAAAQIPGIYVPSLYEVTYAEGWNDRQDETDLPGGAGKGEEADRHGCDQHLLSGETGGSLYESNTGPCGTGDPEAVSAAVVSVSGRYAVPSHQRAWIWRC